MPPFRVNGLPLQAGLLRFIAQSAAPSATTDPTVFRLSSSIYVLDTSGYSHPLIEGLGGVVTVTAAMTPYAVQATDRVILANTTAGAITLTLPADGGPFLGRRLRIVDSHRQFATNNLTINGNTKNINGAATLVISTQDGGTELVWGGTTWERDTLAAGAMGAHASTHQGGGADDLFTGNTTYSKEVNHTVSVAATTTAATAGGNLGLVAGAGSTTGAGGTASLAGGAGGNDAVGGTLSLVAGAAGGGNRAGGAALVTGGAGAGSAAGGAANLVGGVGGATGAGGAISVAGGAGGATSGTGGALVLAGGAGSAGNANGGAVSILGGAKNGSGTDGAVGIGTSNTSSITIGAAGVAFSLGRATVSQATNINTDVTCNGNSGVITTQAATTAAATMEAGFTLNNSCISAASVVQVTIVGYSGTHIANGIPYVAVATPGSGTVAIKVGNIHAANALSGTLKLHFSVS